MTTEFENWVLSNKERLSEDAIGLFSDSVKCLKNGIDRPAFLLAYQGMMVTIREALKVGKAPTGYTEGEWTNLLSKISKEDAWDNAVFDLIRKGPTTSGATIIKEAPLQMPDKVRTQFDYWRIHRNICAHYKNEPFVKAHILSLYSFIQSYLLLITVSGGLQLVLNLLRIYCDPTKTPDDEDILPLLNEIVVRISTNDMDSFLTEAAKVIISSPRKDYIDFLTTILQLTENKFDTLKVAAHKQINSKSNLLHRIIEHNPEYVLTYCNSKEKIYEFMHSDIYLLRRNRLSVIAQLFEAHKIVGGDLREVFQKMQYDFYKDNKWQSFETDSIRNFLIVNGYYDVFLQTYLVSEKINNISELRTLCYKTDFYISHMSAMPITSDVVNRLIEIFGSRKACPYTLYDRFKNELLKDKEYSTKLKSVADEANITLPKDWIEQ